MDEQSGESKEEEVMREGVSELEIIIFSFIL